MNQINRRLVALAVFTAMALTLCRVGPLQAQEATLLNLQNATASPYTLYSYTYTAVLSQTYITFQFRQDPSYYNLDDVSITPLGSGTALAVNGDFEGSTTNMGGQLVPNGWTFVGQAGLQAGGTTGSGCGISSSKCWHDGSVGGVDGLFQSFATTIGSQYTISFELTNLGGGTNEAVVQVGASEDQGGVLVPVPPPPPSTNIISSGSPYLAAGLGTTLNPVFDGGTLQLDNSGLAVSQAFTVNSTNGTIDTAGLTSTMSGVLSGPGGLTFINSGSGGNVRLTNTNTYQGASIINAGAMLALTGTGSIASSSGLADNGSFDISGTTAGAAIQTLSGNGSVALGAQTLTLSNASTTFAGAIGGTGGVAVTGGSQTLSGINTYSGATAIGAGTTLALTGSGSIASSSAVADAGTFNISGTTAGALVQSLSGAGIVTLGARPLTLSNASSSFAGVINGTGAVSVTGGSETLTGSNGYSGATAIASGATIALTGSGSIGASSVVADDGTLDLSGETAGTSLQTLSGTGTVALGGERLTLTNASTTFAGAINGAGAVSITGGTETFSGSSNYSAGTTVSGGGTLIVATDTALGAAAGGLTLIAGSLATTASFTTGRNVALTGNGTFNTSAGSALTDMTGSVSGAGELIKSGTGTLTLCGAVSNTGGTAVNAGTLAICGADTGTGSTAIAAGATLAVSGAGSIAGASAIADNGTLDISGAAAGAALQTLSGNGSVALGTQNLTLTNASTTFTGVIGGSGGVAVISGTQTLSGVNTYGGATAIASGASLILSGTGSIANSSVADSGTFDISATTAGASIPSLSGAGTVALGARTLTLSNAGDIFTGVIGGAGRLALTGGSEMLTGSNTYLGGTAITGGATLVVTGDSALGAAAGALTLNNGTLATTATLTTSRALVLAGVGTIDVADGAAFTDATGAISGAGTLIKAGNGALILCGGVSNLGGTAVISGSLNLCGIDTAPGLTTIASDATLALSGTASIASSSGVANDGIFDISGTTAGASVQSLSGHGAVALGAQNLTLTNANDAFAGAIDGSGGVAVTGGSETFSGVNTYTGGTSISGGARVIVASDAALGNTSGALTLNNGTLEVAGSFTGTRNIVLQGAATFDADAGATLTQTGQVSGNGHVTKDGDGTLVLAGDNRSWGMAGNDTLGGLTINDGLVEVTNSYGLGYGLVTLNSGVIATTVDILTGQSIVIGGDTVLNTDAGTTTTLTGTVETNGTGDCFLKTGAGTLVVAGPTTLSNGTCVEDGRLLANGTLNSVVTVDAGGTLRGTGTITGPITVYGTLAPGNSPGTLTSTASVTMANGSIFQDDINGTGTGAGPGNYSRLLVQGAGSQFIASGATLDINLLNITGAVTYTPYVPLLGDSFRIVTADGGIVGRFAAFAQPAGLASGTRVALFYDQLGNDSIDVRVVPLSYSAFLQSHGGTLSATSAGSALDQILDADQAAVATADQDRLAYTVAGLNAAELPRVLSALAGQVHADMAVVAPEADQWLQRSVARQLDADDSYPMVRQPGDALWMDATINKGKWNADVQGSGFIANRQQIAFGFDLLLGQPNRLGLGFSHSLTDVAAIAGYGSVEENLGFVYGQISLAPLVVDGMFGAGSSRWDTTRADPLAFTTQSLNANPHGNDSLAALGIRWPLHVTGLVLAPYVRALWQRAARDNFSEGDAIDALSGPGYAARGLRSTVGLSGGSENQSPLASVLTYQFDLGVAHDTGRLGRPIVDASLQGAAIEDWAPDTGRTFVLANITGTVRLGKNTYVYLGLSQEARSGKSEDGGINAGVRARF